MTLTTMLLSVFSLAMTTMCLACYSNWFRKRVDGYLWRCVFWSPVILVVCVARQVGAMSRNFKLWHSLHIREHYSII